MNYQRECVVEYLSDFLTAIFPVPVIGNALTDCTLKPFFGIKDILSIASDEDPGKRVLILRLRHGTGEA